MSACMWWGMIHVYAMSSDRISYHLFGRRSIVSSALSSFLLQWSSPRIMCRKWCAVIVTSRCGWTENGRERKLSNGWLGGSRWHLVLRTTLWIRWCSGFCSCMHTWWSGLLNISQGSSWFQVRTHCDCGKGWLTECWMEYVQNRLTCCLLRCVRPVLCVWQLDFAMVFRFCLRKVVCSCH